MVVMDGGVIMGCGGDEWCSGGIWCNGDMVLDSYDGGDDDDGDGESIHCFFCDGGGWCPC